ncbi:MAG: helix-turn-helix domain-containing protein, partial [Clostridia bacterium]|nr:helix-turn-helix domain-containing protein [Clostridia bacterium]
MKNKDYTNIEKTGYTLVPNGILEEKNLSLKALGVYFLICSLPDEWNFSVKGLCTLCSDGYGSVTTAVEELENAGFLHRTTPNGGANRFSDGEWTVRDFPDPKNTSKKKSGSESSCRENHPQLNNKDQI